MKSISLVRCLLPLVVVGMAGLASAQQTNKTGPKTIRGVLVKGLDNYVPQVSPDGAVVALQSAYSSWLPGAPPVVVIDLSNGVIAERRLGDITPDNRYVLGASGDYPETRPGKPAANARGFKVAGIFSDTAERVVFFPYGLNAVNLQAERGLGPGGVSADGMEIMRYDLKTGAALGQVIPPTHGLGNNAALKQTTYTVYQSATECFVAGWGDSEPLVRFPCKGEARAYLADDRFFYLHPKDEQLYSSKVRSNDIVAYDRRTGKQLATHSFPEGTGDQMMYAAFNGRLYRYDRTNAMLYEEEPRDTGFAVTAQCKIPALTLPSSQKWAMVACKGPSVLFVPLNIDAAEAGGVAANTATLFAAGSGKPLLRISPFYTRSAAVLAQQNAAQKAEREQMAIAEQRRLKERAEKDAVAAAEKSALISRYTRGTTFYIGGAYLIFDRYDPATDKFHFWRPGQLYEGKGHWMKPEFFAYKSAEAHAFRPSPKQYYTCTKCDGDGTVKVTEYTTKTKELPWGYFSGFLVTQTRTTATEKTYMCTGVDGCSGQGVVLR